MSIKLYEKAMELSSQLIKEHKSIPMKWEEYGERLTKYDQQIDETINIVRDMDIDLKEKLLIMFYIGEQYTIASYNEDD